jgi:thiol-disulfide isomerase/thioredoxin
MTGGLIALAVALVAATVVGLVLRRRSGQFRSVGSAAPASASARTGSPATSAGTASAAAAAAQADAGSPAAGEPAGAVTPLGSGILGSGSGGPGRSDSGGTVNLLTQADLGAELGARATLVQFSTVFCAPCRPTRQILAQVAGMMDGVRHIEIDATERLDLVGLLRIRSTPTVLVLGPDGGISKRASGLPRKADVIAALGQVIEPVPSTTLTDLVDNTSNAGSVPGSLVRPEASGGSGA